MKVEVVSKVDVAIEAEKEAIQRALEAIGIQFMGDAADYCPVDTGRLRASITYATQDAKGTYGSPFKSGDSSISGTVPEATVIVGTNVEYAPYVEYGTSKSREQSFLRRALQENMDTYAAIFESELSKDVDL